MTEEEENYNMIFKIVLVGDSGVGKTNLLLRYLKNEFNTQTKATVGVEFGNTKVQIDNALIKAQIWDTAGQERYRSITSAYYKGAHGALIVYDITRKDSFDSVEKWLSDLKNNGEEKMVIMAIGNKCDMVNERQVNKDTAEAFAKNLGMQYHETSCKLNINITETINSMILECYKKVSGVQNVFQLNKGNEKEKEKEKEGGCC